MSFKHDSTGVDPDVAGLLPEGDYEFKIIDAVEEVSKKGFNMVKTTVEVSTGDLAGKQIDHYVVFIPKGQKGEGINVHFRKCIGVPYGGNDVVDAQDWIGKRFKAKCTVTENTYKDKSGVEKKGKNNQLSYIEPVEGGAVDSEIPF